MIIPQKKKAVGIILSRFKDGMLPEPAPSLEVKPEQEINEHDEALKAISEDIMQALHSKSAHDLMVALKAFIEEHEMHDESSEEEE